MSGRLKRAVRRWDDWCFTAPWWQLVPVGCVLVGAWLLGCLVLVVWLIDAIMRAWS